MKTQTDTDLIFKLAEMRDPFVSNPYLRAFMTLELADRRRIARQVILLCAVVEGLDPLGALELLAKTSIFVEANRPKPADDR